MLTYVASIPLSTRSLTRLTTLINAHRRELGGRWRALPAHEQALMSLAHLRNGDTLARLAAGFGVGLTTVWRYLREAIDLLTAEAADVAAAAHGPPGWPTRSSTAPSFRSTGLLIRSRTTRENTSAMASTSRSWLMQPGVWCGPRRRCPARCMT